MEQLLARLRRFDALRDGSDGGRGDIVLTRKLPCKPPDFAPESSLGRLPVAIRRALSSLGIRALYAHQAQAIESILSGEDVVLEAPTASGKTLCFNIPLVLGLLESPHSHALMVHPMKALSNDQRRQFEELAGAVEAASARRLESWVFDGDLDPEHRRLLKAHPPAVLFTNPEMLHQSFLGWQEQWTTFLSHLRLVILDEIHEYRGYFGTNVALLLRRFFAKLSQLGVRPQIVLATATCGNAEEHAYRLTGRRCKVVRAATTMRPERHFAFIDPDIPDFRFYEIYLLRIARAALACVSEGLSTLVFCPSRRFAEEAAVRAKRDAVEYGIDAGRIAPYRSGYEAALRREIEEGLRTGRFQAVFCTNALEIGVDIGRLDACILAGFPDSVLSAWQRIGRVGRSWEKKAYVLFYALNNPFDKFFASNIDAFLNKPLDEILIGIDNEELMSRHLPYLVHECGGEVTRELEQTLGSCFYNFSRKAMAGKKPVRGVKPNYQQLKIRGGSGMMYRLLYKGKEIGEISDIHLFREAYVGAIYNHFGRPYKVAAHGAAEVLLEEADPHLRTEGVFWTVIHGPEILSGRRYAESIAACYGKLTVFENFGGFKLIDTHSGQVVREERGQLARSSSVRGFWLELANLSALGGDFEARDLVGLEQLLRIGAPFVVPCDRHDLSTHTTLRDPPTVYLYESVPGGIGVAERALELWPRIIETAIRIAEKCPCKRGCPSCLMPPRPPSGFEEPKKDRAMALARRLLSIAEKAALEKFDPGSHAWVPAS
ncbi:DEAD/DEAH box helicase [Limisphaera sp. VF-2]|uniref:DEAD/DEAH box helicase n=1 Tax=Limisphaera sp. VF-2 TaxID=3400418 RepID=UPI0017599CB1